MKKSAITAASAVMAISLGLAGAAEAATLRIIALTGQEAPGTGGALFSDFDDERPALNDSGEVAFYAELEGPGVTAANDVGIFTSGALVARTGDPAPGVGGAVYESFGNEPALNNAGETAFRARLTGPGVTPDNNTGVFTSGALVARDGDAAPGIGGAVYSQGVSPFFGRPSLNDVGQVAFTAVFDGPGVTLDNRRGIIASGALVERTGNVAPGTGGAEFLFLGSPTLTSAGETVFYGTVSSGPGMGTQGIFSESGVLVQQGDAVPGLGGAVFTAFSTERPALNDAGELAFVGLFEGPGVTDETNIGLFASGALVARRGDPAPGAGGATFFPRLIEPVGLNNAGDLAFQGRLEGAGITDANNDALFAWRGGVLEMILREGDLLDIGGGELRPILSFEFGGQSGFNENGDIAFFADLGPIAGGGGVIGIGPGA